MSVVASPFSDSERHGGRELDVTANRARVLGPRRLSGHVAAHIKSMIASGALAPGDRINESHLMKELGVSRSPVREAILSLEGQGLAVVRPHHGAFVRPVDDAVLHDIAEVRAVLEGAVAAELAGRIREDPTLLDPLAELADLMTLSARSPDPDRLAEAHMGFHDALIGSSPNPVLREMLAELRELTELFITLGHREFMRSEPDALARQHQQLIEVFRTGDPDASERAYRAHIDYAHRPPRRGAAARQTVAETKGALGSPLIRPLKEHR